MTIARIADPVMHVCNGGLRGSLFWLIIVALTASAPLCSADEPVIQLRAYGVPSEFKFGPADAADRQVIAAFRHKFPGVHPVSLAGLSIPGGERSSEMVPLMQIAGDMAADVMFVNFKESQTYIGLKLLYPLDQYVEKLADVQVPDGSALNLEAYIDALKGGAGWAVMSERVAPQCWPVMRRECPYGEDCPYRRQWGVEPRKSHEHIWSFPIRTLVRGLIYDRALMAEHAADGVEQRVPRDWEELLRWAKTVTNPRRKEYGLRLQLDNPAWEFLTFLYSAGGEAVQRDQSGNWHCTLDTEAAVETAYFFARLRHERIERDGEFYRGVICPSSAPDFRFAMGFDYLDEEFLTRAADRAQGFGAVPAGPGGLRRSEFNARMCGIFSGLAGDGRRRDAAWNYIEFYDSPAARRIHTQSMVEAGLGEFLPRTLLEQFNDGGRYDGILRRISPELEETYRIAWAGGVPEPYGRNCQYVYEEISKPIGGIWNSEVVRRAIDAGDAELAKREIRQILRRATQRISEKMLGNIPLAVQSRRNTIAWLVIAIVLAAFVFSLFKVVRSFAPPDRSTIGPADGRPQRSYGFAYLLMAPALGSLALWVYWPLARGSAIAFQDYSVAGDSHWVGAANFASALFNGEFWYSLRVSLLYAALFLLLGFWLPIGLALLLHEVPRGKTFFRVIYYVPAVLSGAVVIFLWKNFYSPDGVLNEVINAIRAPISHLFGIWNEPLHRNWLDEPTWALLLTLVPTIWAGAGPGCLIYLAALKTVPDELYEAADIDGAGTLRKVFSVALPSIRALIAINFIGAVIGAVRGAGTYVLAMTGGGPYGEHGGATEVVGLKIFYTTFGNLQFGVGAAMAWVLGAMLIGFTVFQLRRLSRLEFATARAREGR